VLLLLFLSFRVASVTISAFDNLFSLAIFVVDGWLPRRRHSPHTVVVQSQLRHDLGPQKQAYHSVGKIVAVQGAGTTASHVAVFMETTMHLVHLTVAAPSFDTASFAREMPVGTVWPMLPHAFLQSLHTTCGSVASNQYNCQSTGGLASNDNIACASSNIHCVRHL
jgi:hypothetical protein